MIHLIHQSKKNTLLDFFQKAKQAMNIAWRQAYSIAHKGIKKYIIKVIKTAKGFLSDPHSWFMHIFRDIFPQIFKKKEYFSLNHGYEKLCFSLNNPESMFFQKNLLNNKSASTVIWTGSYNNKPDFNGWDSTYHFNSVQFNCSHIRCHQKLKSKLTEKHSFVDYIFIIKNTTKR